MNRVSLSRVVFIFGFCLPMAAFAGFAEESVEGDRLWNRHVLALGIWAVAILLGGALLVALTNSSRRQALFGLMGALFVLGYGISLVHLKWSNPSGVAAGWCVSVAWVSGLWLSLRRQPHAQGSSSTSWSVQSLLKRKPLDDLLDWVRFRVDTFPRNVGWLKALGLREMHNSTYHELPWVGVRSGWRDEGTKTRWERIEPLVEAYGVRSALDVGAEAGWFCFKLAEHGVPAVAVEKDMRGLRLGTYTRKRSGLEDVSFLSMQVTRSNVNLLPSGDLVLLLSIWHHFVREGGLEAGTEILANVWKRTGKLLFFETGEDEMPASYRLPAMLPNPQTWLTEYLEKVCAGATVLHLGRHAALSPSNEPCQRNLFVAIRGEPLPDQPPS